MKVIILALSCLISTLVHAETTISGNVNPMPGSVETYTVTWAEWNSQIENLSDVCWSVYKGTILSSDKFSVTIEWNLTTEREDGYIDVYENLTGMHGFLNIRVENYVLGVSEACTKTLGVPAIFENFGAGNNPGPAYAGCIYQYKTTCAIFPGDYTRTNSTVGCRSLWLGLPEDHTPGDVNGYMLMIDGDDRKGQIFSANVTGGLNAAFRYEFSAWAASLYGGSETPEIYFRVVDNSGNLIHQSPNIEIPYDATNPWKKISVMVDIPLGTTSLTLIVVNNNRKRDGNDFVIDDLSFAPCYSPIIASFSNTAIIEKSYTCNNGTVNLYASWPTPVVPFTNPKFKWQRSTDGGFAWTDIPTAVSMSYTQTENTVGIYKYRIYAYENLNPSFNFVSNEITYFVQKMVVEAKTYNVFSCNPAPVELSPNWSLQYTDLSPIAYYANTYSWTPGTYLSSISVQKPLISLPALTPPNINAQTAPPPVPYNYTFTVQNTIFPGCIASNTQTVMHYNPRKVVVPTSFTPNGDGLNDLFRPLNLQDYPGGEFWVWNRLGNLVFNSQGPTLLDYSWNGNYSNGQPADIGNYVWRVYIPGCANNILNGAGGTQINNPYGNVILAR